MTEGLCHGDRTPLDSDFQRGIMKIDQKSKSKADERGGAAEEMEFEQRTTVVGLD